MNFIVVARQNAIWGGGGLDGKNQHVINGGLLEGSLSSRGLFQGGPIQGITVYTGIKGYTGNFTYFTLVTSLLSIPSHKRSSYFVQDP